MIQHAVEHHRQHGRQFSGPATSNEGKFTIALQLTDPVELVLDPR